MWLRTVLTVLRTVLNAKALNWTIDPDAVLTSHYPHLPYTGDQLSELRGGERNLETTQPDHSGTQRRLLWVFTLSSKVLSVQLSMLRFSFPLRNILRVTAPGVREILLAPILPMLPGMEPG